MGWSRRRPLRVLAALILLVAAALAVSGDHRFPAPSPVPGPPRDAPTAVVALGDSTIAGEGAGSYEPGTDGRAGDWCHRSIHAAVHQLGLPGIDDTINLGCSGAPSSQVGFGRVKQYTEPSQAARLAAIATTHRVVAVVVATGANDEPAFSHVLNRCVSGWALQSTPACGEAIGPDWQHRVDAAIPKIVNALGDVRSAMRTAGYRQADYQLVVQSYAAPVGPDVAESLRNLSGCPFLRQDLRWIQNTAVPALTTALTQAAAQAHARFLDLSRAATGHEACSSPDDPTREWFTRLTVQWTDLTDEARATHATQESFHPNATGYAQFGRCLGEFLATTARAAACLAGADGNLHPAITIGSGP